MLDLASICADGAAEYDVGPGRSRAAQNRPTRQFQPIISLSLQRDQSDPQATNKQTEKDLHTLSFLVYGEIGS